MSPREPKVEAWAVVGEHGVESVALSKKIAATFVYAERRLVRLVEPTPVTLDAIAAHIKRALRNFNSDNGFDAGHDALQDALRALAALQPKKRKS